MRGVSSYSPDLRSVDITLGVDSDAVQRCKELIRVLTYRVCPEALHLFAVAGQDRDLVADIWGPVAVVCPLAEAMDS